MSAAQTWFASTIARPRSRSGYILGLGAALLVPWRGTSALALLLAIARSARTWRRPLDRIEVGRVLHFLYYNFVRIHKTLKVTPAMAASVTDRLWDVADMANVLETWESATKVG